MNDIGNYEAVSMENYDLDNITCYECTGETFKGYNVICSAGVGRSAWVNDNMYDVFEAPAIYNLGDYKFTGDFLYLAHNVDFDYWLFGKSNDTLTLVPSKNGVQPFSEKYTCTLCGRYSVIIGGISRRRKLY